MSLSPVVVELLSQCRKTQLELRLKLGMGKLEPDSLLFGKIDGTPRSPRSVTHEWRRLVKRHNLPAVTLHSLRHGNASSLIANGVYVVDVSRRLGHSSPSITLDVYSHLFPKRDDHSSAIIDDMLGAIRGSW